MKKFYKTVTTHSVGSGYGILLDGKPLKTPEKDDLIVPNEAVAILLMQEWAGQDEAFDPKEMPISQIAMTAQDYIIRNRNEIEKQLKHYLETDLICYHSDDLPERMAYEEKHWLPWLAWFNEAFGIDRPVQKDLAITPPSDADFEKLEHYIQSLDLHHFTLFQMLVSLSGSIILSAAFMQKEINADMLFKLSKLEELFTIEHLDIGKYGSDPIQKKEFDVLKRDFSACEAYLEALK